MFYELTSHFSSAPKDLHVHKESLSVCAIISDGLAIDRIHEVSSWSASLNTSFFFCHVILLAPGFRTVSRVDDHGMSIY